MNNYKGICCCCGERLYLGDSAYIDDNYNVYCNSCVEAIGWDKCHGCDNAFDEEGTCDDCERDGIKFYRVWIDCE